MDSSSWIHGYSANSNDGRGGGFMGDYTARCSHNVHIYYSISAFTNTNLLGSCLVKDRTAHLIDYVV
jgi:hypothetical protein